MPNYYRLMHEDDMDNSFEVTPELTQVIDQNNNHLPAEKALEDIREFNLRLATSCNVSE